MQVAIIRATAREGYRGYYTPNRFWPDTPVVVEVVDQEDDPLLSNGKIDTTKVGQKTLRQIKSEHAAFSIRETIARDLESVQLDAAGSANVTAEPALVEQLRAELAQALAGAELERRDFMEKLHEKAELIAELEKKLEACAQAPGRVAELERQIKELKKKIRP